MTFSAACAGIAGARPTAFFVGLGMFKIGVTGVPGAGRECADAIADLDQMAEHVVGLVPAGLVPMITVVT